ncbi:CdaR family transcriptional regulator [Paenibacillus sedimenti]|uniref:Helix-turn-helix domain-containing protein n=1 Tax=Paenibacillus sedimenti TaxID=2770274 RepID=A0A926QK04_9BACL|nr:sugar diacid recognition domain-containing protein [Paenibacillus sedimenti]MBD0382090.1 helix-turn-helix domain-containing protein [Paenibacillus sedimenti]
MRFTRQLADTIVSKTKELTLLNMNVMDRNGIILSSSDPDRIGTLHAGAIEVVRTGEEIVITAETAGKLAGTKPGINMPIFFQNELVGVIGITGQESEVVPFGRAVRMMTEMLLQQSYLSEQVELKERAKSYLVGEIMVGVEPENEDMLYARGELLGIDLSLPRAVMAIEICGHESTRDQFYQSFQQVRGIVKLFPNPQQTVLAELGNQRWILMADLSAYKNEKVSKQSLLGIASKIFSMAAVWFKGEARIAVGGKCGNIKELGRSVHDALKLVDMLRKDGGLPPVMHIEDTALEFILNDIPEASGQRLIEKVLGELAGDDLLMETLQTFYDQNMNLATTAKAMNIHRNTLLYRLERVQSLLGMNPRSFRNAIRIQIALLLYRKH